VGGPASYRVRMTTELPGLDRCPACGAAVRPGDPWCTLCYADLRPAAPPAVEVPVPDPLTGPVAGQPAGSAYPPAPPDPLAVLPPATPDPLTAPLTGPVAGQPAGSAYSPAPPDPLTAPLAAISGPTWPCSTCGTVNPLDRDACVGCGAAFLSAVREQESPLLTLPVVGDITRLSRMQRFALAGGVVVAFLLLTLLLGVLFG
jgi:hypothetical protein